MSTQMNKTIAEYFKTQPVLKAWLFGSFARGEETPRSDVDILFVAARSMKADGMAVEKIEKYTGLTAQEIEGL